MAADSLLVKRVRLVSAGLTADVPSPCTSVCRVNAQTELCEGCYRTLDEITAWSRMEDEAKRDVWKAIGERIQKEAAS